MEHDREEGLEGDATDMEHDTEEGLEGMPQAWSMIS